MSFLPAVFSSGVSAPEPAAKRDICCQTSRFDCWWIKQGGQTCICGEIRVVQFPGCSDPSAACFTIKYGEQSCNDSTGFEHTCETSDFGELCDGAPTPTPEPRTCPCNDPQGRKPNYSCSGCFQPPNVSEPLWFCDICFTEPQVDVCKYPPTGCPMGYFNDGSSCCKTWLAYTSCTTPGIDGTGGPSFKDGPPLPPLS